MTKCQVVPPAEYQSIAELDSLFCDRLSLGRGVKVQLSGRVCRNILDHCMSGGLTRPGGAADVLGPISQSDDRQAQGWAITLRKDNLVRTATIEKGRFGEKFE